MRTGVNNYAYETIMASSVHRIPYPTSSIVGVAMDDPRLYIRRTGEIVLIDEMAKEHLLAAINMIERGYDYQGRPVPTHTRLKIDALKEAAQRKGFLNTDDGWDP